MVQIRDGILTENRSRRWYFDGEQIKLELSGECLDESGDGSGNLYVYPCHNGDNQRFYWDGHRLHNRKWGSAKCVDYNAGNGKNLYMHECHSGANQQFNWKIALRIKSRKDPSMCLDMNTATKSVQMHPCHHHKNQLFWFDGAVLKTDYDHSLCLDYHPSTSDLYFHQCHSGDNQKFIWSGEQIKVIHDMSKCWYWQSTDNNVFGADCSSHDDQKFFFDTPYHKGKRLQSEASPDCMDAHNGNAYTVGCHDGSWQRWYFEGEQIKVEGNANKCLDYNLGAGQTENGNVNLHDCHSGSNQKWYWDGKLLKSRNDNRCLDVNPGDNNVFVGSCPDDNTQHWTHRTDLHNSRQLTVGGGKCLQDTGSNVEATGCGNTAGLMWYFDGELLKTEANNKCLDVNTGDGNLYMYNCHSGNNQKFYFDGNLIKTRQEDLCLDYQVISGNAYAGSCPHHEMSQYRMEGGAMLKKHPLPEEFEHGQSLRVACWSERFKSPQTETLSCVAGSWINSRGKRGLDGFSCAACVQVVTPKYAAFDAQIRQELFFVSGLQLQLTVDTRTPQSVTASGNLRAGGNKDIFVAELLPDAEETLRRYRSITTAGQCLTATAGNSLTATACAKEAEPLQMLEVMELSSLMWQEFKASASVPSPTTLYLANRGSAPTTLRSFVLFNGDCGDHAITSIGFYHGTRSGMTSACTAASTYGNHVEHHIDVPGHVQISSVSAGTCLSIHHIIPWLLKDRWSGLCLDHHPTSGNVYAHNCHNGNNQMWYMIDGTIISMHDGKCLDYHTGTTNVYMHECHDGSNQRWYFDEETAQIRSEFDHQCLDVNMGGSGNVYIHPCHDGNNQKFDRFEKSSSAFNKALQLECSGSPEEEIKVEPIGSENKFHLKSGNHQLPGEWHYDAAKKRIKNVHSNKCLKAHHPHAAREESCMESIEQEWILGHGLQGLADAPISCKSNQVLSFFEKGHGHIRYKCVHVAALGSCVPGYSAQVETKALELEDVKALKRMTATCPTGHGLRALEAEASDKGAWIRLRYECCQINRVPVSLYPYIGGGGQREFMSDLADGWEGIYCPSSQDDSGRMQFSQSRSFRPHHNPSGSLQYNKFQGQWCVSGKVCASSDVVHPLDMALSTHEWHVVPVSDFDAVFEARGVKPLGGNHKRSPPPLIKFGSSDPDYLPECKDESHPGARKFKLALMNKEAEDLDDENPCKYVFGKPPKNQQMDESEGMTGWIDDLSGTTEPGQGGVTYKSVKECSDRDIVRELKLGKWNKEHWDATKYNWIVEDILDGIGNSFALETAPMGFGVELNPFGLAAAIGTMAVHGVEFHYDQQIADREMHFEQAGHDDCNPIQHGFARTFCDLHCIRDAVRKGDDAILRALEEAVEIVGKNTQLLLEYYVGEDSKPGLIENGLEIKHGIAKSMGEMFATARRAALEPRASVAATRAINVFAKRWSGANVSEIPRLVSELQDLHGTIAKLSSRKLSRGKEVQRYAVQMASQMNKYMQAQSHILGIYHHESSTSKLLQRRLNRFWRSSVSSSALLLEVEEETAEEDIKEFDSMWWEIRKELDGYLQASQEHVRATQTAAQMLQDYSAKCTSGFSEMKRAYTLSVRAETHAHKILQRAWAAVSTGVAEMASKVADGAILDHLAVHDLHSLNPKATVSKMNRTEIQVFCDGSIDGAFTVVRKAAAEAMKKGLYGQTHRQLMVLFEELKMLQSRFISGGLGPIPDVDLVQDAQTRLQSALLQSAFGSSKVAKAMVKQLRTTCDVLERGSKPSLGGHSQAK